MTTDLLVELVALKTNLQLAHWQASSVTNEHATLGALYGKLDGLLDEFAEVTLGKLGAREFPDGKTINLLAGAKPAALLKSGFDLLAAIRAELAEDDGDLRNIADEMQAELNRARYLLEVKI